MSEKPHPASPPETDGESAFSDKSDAARIFVLALEEAHGARLRARLRTRVIGVHGNDFESRDARVERIVEKFNERAVKTARKNALRVGWSKDQLASMASDVPA